MQDLRKYRDVIKAAVARERAEDKNWSWRVDSITKGVAKIGWGYLDYLEEKELFMVEIDDTDESVMVIGTKPNGLRSYRLIGPESWNDCKTIEDGISSIIHSMAVSARNTY